MSLSRRFFPAFLIGLFLFAGAAQAQKSAGGTNPQNSEMKADGNYLQPWQPCLNAGQDQEEIKGSLQVERRNSSQTIKLPIINKPSSKDKTAVGDENTIHKSDSSGILCGKPRGSRTQKMSTQGNVVGGLSTIPATVQSSGLGSSFLDGYLLKFLQNKEMGRKKVTRSKEKGDLSRKPGTTEKESPDDPFQKRVKRAY